MDQGLATAELPPEISASFVAEARGYLPAILEGLMAPAAPDRLAEAYRLAHTIRSSAAMLGFTGLSQIAELLEGDLEDLQAGLPAAPGTLAQLERSVGRIGRLLDAVAGEPVDIEAILADEVADRTGGGNTSPASVGLEPAETVPAAAEPAGGLSDEPVSVPGLLLSAGGDGPASRPEPEVVLTDRRASAPVAGTPAGGPSGVEGECPPDMRDVTSRGVGEAGEGALPGHPLGDLPVALDPDSASEPEAAGAAGLPDLEDTAALLDTLAEMVLALGRACSTGGIAPAAVRRELATWLDELDRRLGQADEPGEASSALAENGSPSQPAGAASMPVRAHDNAGLALEKSDGDSAAALELDPAGAAEQTLRQTIEAELRFQIEEEVRARLAADAAVAMPAGLSLLGRLRPVAGPGHLPITIQTDQTGQTDAGADQRDSRPGAEGDSNAELRAIFALEAAEHLKRIDADLIALEAAPGSLEILRSLRRTVHTLKGAAAMMGMAAVATLAHSIEDRLDAATGGEDGRAARPLEPQAYSALLGDLDRLEQLIQSGGALGDAHAGALPAPPAELAEQGEPAPETTAHRGLQASHPGQAGKQERAPVAVPVRLERLDDLLRIAGETSVAVAAWPALLAAAGSALSDVRRSIGRVQSLVSELEAERRTSFGRRDAGRLAQVAGTTSEEQGEAAEWVFDPLELDRYTPADRLTRELAEIAVETHAAERELASALESAGEVVMALRRHAGALQEQLLEARLVPLDELMGRLQRAVRSVALRRGKEASLVFDGHGVAVDRAILDSITEALVHLVRNAVDHGIEPPEVRARAGKARAGTVHVRAHQERGEVRVEVADDGAGIDLERLATAAQAAGRDAGASPEERLRLMFEPGISTAREVDEISGRGVGLDAVREALARVRGTIEVASEPGHGTIFRLTFPVTLAQARVVMAEVAGNPVAVPVAHVRRIARRASITAERLGHEEVARLDGEAFPIADLAAALGYEVQEPLPVNPPVLFIEVAGRRAALLAGAVGGEQEIVVQPTGRHLWSLRGVAGATVLQDGRVALLLHLPDLLEAPRQARPSPAALPAGAPAAATAPLAAGQQALEVLVVDDSPTIRKLLVRMLKDLGWQPREAKDGAEALEEIRLRRPDAVLADVEMPRLDGYGLLAALRARPETADLPVLMLTSRTAARHRQRAAGLGASGYLTKPYRPADVVAALRAVCRVPAAEAPGGPAAAGAVA